jgi:hypothetical protein
VAALIEPVTGGLTGHTGMFDGRSAKDDANQTQHKK